MAETPAVVALTGPDVRLRPARPVRRAVLRHARLLAETFFTTDAGPPPPERLDALERDVADFMGRMDLSARWLIQLCLFVTFRFAPLVIGRLTGFMRLSPEDRERALLRLDRTPLSLAVLGSKALLCLVYFETPGAAQDIGMPGTCSGSRS